MTVYPALMAANQPFRLHPPRWNYQRQTPVLTSEGDEVVLTLSVSNYNVGSKIQQWMAGGKSLASTGNWERSWHDVFTEACEAVGCSYQRSSSSTNPPVIGTIAGVIEVGPDYAGQMMVLRNRSRRNRRTDATNPDGTPGYREMQILMETLGDTPEDRAFNGTNSRFVGGNLVRVQDTSQRPVGMPTLRQNLTSVDGLAAVNSLFEGDSFRLTINTTNILPGTAVKIYAATDGGRDITTPRFRTAIGNAAPLVGCEIDVPGFDPNDPTAWYNGGTITFTEAYDDANPVTMVMTVDSNATEESTRQIIFIAQILAEGDAAEFDSIRSRGDWNDSTIYRRGDWVTYLVDGGRYIYTDDSSSIGVVPTDTERWREFRTTQTSNTTAGVEVRDVPPRFWELRAVSDGSQITYTIQGPTGAVGDSVALESVNPPPGFDAALAAACHAGAGVSYEAGRLYAQAADRSDSAVTFTVPHAGAGKHTLRITDPIGPSYLVIADACVYLTPPVLPADPDFIVGVNLGSAAGGSTWPNGEPSVYGTHYVYNSEPEHPEPRKHREMDYHWSRGVRIIRVPFKWERIQPVPFGPLFGGGGTGSWTTPNRQDMRRLDEQLWYWTQVLGGIALIDCHNYMSYSFQEGGGGKIAYDNPDTPIAMLTDLWVKLADHYADNPRVWFGIMNEPNGSKQTPVRVGDTHHAVVNAIRARTPALNKIFMSGAEYSAARSWVSNGQGAAYASFYDPADNFAFEPHTYFDDDASGTKGTCEAGAQTRLVAITEWARANGFRLFMGELAGGDPAIEGQAACGPVVTAAYQYMSDNRDVWLGWTTWGAGRFWNRTYIFRLDPADYYNPVDTGCMQMLIPFLADQ
ncbi:cellulase family glycosylhydrolase [Sphingomonas sp. IW22]|uniref:cellulase family glycosylhydrolase n=1 Tax=Sphingomonas sp. IW22 TaxID=3242489 RepID=UPI00352248CD